MTQYFFDGDPATDSTRRHLERVLKQPQKHRWTWVAAMVAGGAVFNEPCELAGGRGLGQPRLEFGDVLFGFLHLTFCLDAFRAQQFDRLLEPGELFGFIGPDGG